eukprot:9498830-Pyramimonas_sp.AAC.1
MRLAAECDRIVGLPVQTRASIGIPVMECSAPTVPDWLLHNMNVLDYALRVQVMHRTARRARPFWSSCVPPDRCAYRS